MASQKHILPLSLIWTAITLFFVFLLLLLDISNERDALRQQGRNIQEHANDRLLVHEALLHNFVTRIAEDDEGQSSKAHNYARHIRSHYPHILRFLILEKVAAADVAAFERKAQASGLEGFRILTPPQGGSGERQIRANKALYYPVIHMEPYSAGAMPLIGMDLHAHPATRAALEATNHTKQITASQPYQMIDGKLGYLLFLAVHDGPEDEDGRNPHPSQQIAALAVELDKLFPSRWEDPELNFKIYDPNGELRVNHTSNATPSLLSSWLLPTLAEKQVISRLGDEFEVLTEKQLTWSALNWPILLVVLAFSLIAFVLTEHNLHRKQVAESAQRRLYSKLTNERQKLEERVVERTQELVHKNAELRMQVKENRRLTQKILNIQEEERRNLARELHDEMGQSLTAIRTDAHLLKQLTPDDEQHRQQRLAADSIDHIAQRIYSVTYGLMRSLRPSTLDDLGLVDALRECIANAHLELKGIQIHQSLKGALNELDEQTNITCYRLLQEALSNIIKHAQATEVWFRAELSEATPEKGAFLEVEVRDNGRGFDLRAVSQHKNGFGLLGMRERVLALRGDFLLDSTQGQGTCVKARIPIDPHLLDTALDRDPDPASLI